MSEATRRSIVEYALAKRQQRPEQFADAEAQLIDERMREFVVKYVEEALDIVAEEVGRTEKLLREELRREIHHQVNFAGDKLYSTVQRDISAAVKGAANKLIIFDSSNPEARKHIDADRDKILDWNAARKRG